MPLLRLQRTNYQVLLQNITTALFTKKLFLSYLGKSSLLCQEQTVSVIPQHIAILCLQRTNYFCHTLVHHHCFVCQEQTVSVIPQHIAILCLQRTNYFCHTLVHHHCFVCKNKLSLPYPSTLPQSALFTKNKHYFHHTSVFCVTSPLLCLQRTNYLCHTHTHCTWVHHHCFGYKEQSIYAIPRYIPTALFTKNKLFSVIPLCIATANNKLFPFILLYISTASYTRAPVHDWNL